MTTLGTLTVQPTPAQSHLGQNAKPTLAELVRAISELQNAVAGFSGVNDNRSFIENLAGLVVDRAADLAAVSDGDAVAMVAEAQFVEYRNRIAQLVRFLDHSAGEVFTDDASTQYPLKQFRLAVVRVRGKLVDLKDGVDNRSAIADAVNGVLARLDEVRAMGSGMAGWRYTGVERGCDALLKALAERIPTMAPNVPTTSLTLNPSRLAFNDAVDELYGLHLAYLGNSHEFLKHDRTALLQRLRETRASSNAASSEPLEKDALFPQMQDIRSRYLNLERQLQTSGDTPLMNPAREGFEARQAQFARIIAMVAPPVPTPKPNKPLMGRVAGVFGWGDEEPEAA